MWKIEQPSNNTELQYPSLKDVIGEFDKGLLNNPDNQGLFLSLVSWLPNLAKIQYQKGIKTTAQNSLSDLKNTISV